MYNKIISILRFKLNNWQQVKQLKQYGTYQQIYDHDLSLTEAASTYSDRNSLYSYMHHYYNYRCPQIVKEHREYFKKEHRGFGEDAFHAMWWLLLLEFQPTNMLEIGVYRGQVISLWSLISKYVGRSVEVHGISPFSPLGDSVSNYLENLNYLSDVKESFEYWKLQKPILIKALSTDKQAIDHISSQSWDIVYIDGSHDYDVAIRDYEVCKDALKPGGILVLDDSSLGTDFKPPSFSFAGHPGPSRIARERADKEMIFICAVGHNSVYKKD